MPFPLKAIIEFPENHFSSWQNLLESSPLIFPAG
jgi:hypothetical protein